MGALSCPFLPEPKELAPAHPECVLFGECINEVECLLMPPNNESSEVPEESETGIEHIIEIEQEGDDDGSTAKPKPKDPNCDIVPNKDLSEEEIARLILEEEELLPGQQVLG